jgi:DnaJ-class molecular chaperone
MANKNRIFGPSSIGFNKEVTVEIEIIKENQCPNCCGIGLGYVDSGLVRRWKRCELCNGSGTLKDFDLGI